MARVGSHGCADPCDSGWGCATAESVSRQPHSHRGVTLTQGWGHSHRGGDIHTHVVVPETHPQNCSCCLGFLWDARGKHTIRTPENLGEFPLKWFFPPALTSPGLSFPGDTWLWDFSHFLSMIISLLHCKLWDLTPCMQCGRRDTNARSWLCSANKPRVWQ